MERIHARCPSSSCSFPHPAGVWMVNGIGLPFTSQELGRLSEFRKTFECQGVPMQCWTSAR